MSGASTADFELLTRVTATLGNAVSAGALTVQLLKWNDFARALARFHEKYDLMLTPTLAHPPIRHGMGDPSAAEQVCELLSPLPLAGACGEGRIASTEAMQVGALSTRTMRLAEPPPPQTLAASGRGGTAVSRREL